MSFIQAFIRVNKRLCRAFDRAFLPNKYRVDGNWDFVNQLLPQYVSPGLTVYDVGGGKRPIFGVDFKNEYQMRVIGVDISGSELDRAPVGSYDEKIASDIAQVRGRGNGDLVVCQAVLEHVMDNEKAIAAISTLLKESGRALIFVPSRNAAFARLNILLPQKVKEWILYSVYPHARQAQGFPSYYDHCTPRDFEEIAGRYGMAVERMDLYYISSYFQFFLPLYVAWRVCQQILSLLIGVQAAETFSMVLVKRSD